MAPTPRGPLEAPPAQTIVVTWEGEDEELAAALRDGGFARWALPRLPGWRFEVGRSTESNAAHRAPNLVLQLARFPVHESFRAAVRGLPIVLEGAAFSLGRGRYEIGPSTILAFQRPTPSSPTDPATWWVAGRSVESITAAVDEILFQSVNFGRRGRPRPRFDYLVEESSSLSRRGVWKTEGGLVEPDPTQEIDQIAERDLAYERLVALPTHGATPSRVTVWAAPEESQRRDLLAWANGLEATLDEFCLRMGRPLAGAPIRIAIESDAAALARHAGALGAGVRGSRSDLALVFDSRDASGYRFALAGLLLERSGLTSDLPPALRDGAALWLSRDWYGREALDWVPLWIAGGDLPSAEELWAREPPSDFSPLLATPIAVALLERRPGRTLAEKLASNRERPIDLAWGRAELEALRRSPATQAPKVSRPEAPVEPREPRGPREFLRGVSFAMRNSIDGGYHAPIVERELARLSSLGSNAISLMPFGFQSDPREPTLAFRHDSPSSETDFGLTVAARRAHAQGFRVLWKPHLWISHDSWPGEVEMTNEADWQTWWRSYRRYVLHQAVLARWAEAELFSVGVELDRTTGREREWRDLIAAVRRIAPRAAITYSANWDRAETSPLWDAVDLVGVDSYFPLAAAGEEDPTALTRGAEDVTRRLAVLAAKTGRPVLLTEFGFPARRAAWSDPHSEEGEFSEVDQATAYRAMLSALGRPPWLAGLFLWKSNSNESTMSPEVGTDFRFLGRAAEHEIRSYFANPEPRGTAATSGKRGRS